MRSGAIHVSKEEISMKFSRLLAGCLLGAALVAPAAAVDIVYTAALDAEAGVASPGIGFTRVTVDTDDHTMRVEATWSGLVSPTSVAHIHCCTAVAFVGNAGVATGVPTFEGFPAGVTAGSYDHTFDMTLAASWNPAFITAQGNIDNAFMALVGGLNTGHAYLNIHSEQFGAGEIRGYLVPVPEPETYALMIAGLAAIALVARRRRIT
jgi:hypothetical protein